MIGAHLRRRLDRVAGTVPPGAIDSFNDPGYLDELARWAGVSPIEVVAEARRIDALCRANRAWTTEARLAVIAADGAVSVEALRAGVVDAQRTLREEAL